MNKKMNKKSVLFSLSIILLTVVLFFFSLTYQYKSYVKEYNNKINSIVNEVLSKYPDVSEDEIISLLNSNSSSSNILEKYGIDENNSSIDKNDTLFMKYLIFDMVLIIIIMLIISGYFLYNNVKRRKKIDDIVWLISKINNRNYKLEIENYDEDELSSLKSEIYKFTIMLRSESDNSLKDKIKLKDSLSDISHQLKTPLTSITIMIDNILESANMDESTRNRFLISIKREIINMNFLVQNLLKLSKFDANVVKFSKREVKLHDIIYSAYDKVNALSDLKNVNVKISGDDSSTLVCDEMWQIEALGNILKNSIEHSCEGGIVEINYTKNKVYSRIVIRDNGSGICEKDLPHIFERFYKGENSSKDSVGIGLALAKSIIEKDNGSISVKSSSKIGTIFTIKYFK